jgi:hypothetical protein
MSDKCEFVGTVLRVEPDGFGIVKFRKPIGRFANQLGMFSSTTSTVLPFSDLRPGVEVFGTAESDDHDLAAVKTLTVIEGSPKR